MTFKALTLGVSLLALAACGNTDNDLRGAKFIAPGNGANITLAFDTDDMRFYGQVVNLYNGEYTVDGNAIKFNQGAMTMMMGPANAMATESEYFQFLATVERYDLTNRVLTLTAADGATMTFNQVEVLPDDTVVVSETDAVVIDTPVAE